MGDPYGQSECGDFTKYNPWRAPGKAPVMDPCGIASGFTNPGRAEVPQGYRGGQKGSEVLPEVAPTYWKAGGTAQVGWGLSAQHGGGYSYRLCPKGSTITEECFQSNTLRFTAKNSTIHFDDGSHADIKVPTKTYVAPDGTEWRTNPIPGCACDNGLSCGGKGFLESKSQSNHTHGEYVLSWRWDCEETDQVWNSCADIVITDGPVPAPTPAPPAPPSPSPGKGGYLCFKGT